jgi:mono/diheme cytochrome c family protein
MNARANTGKTDKRREPAGKPTRFGHRQGKAAIVMQSGEAVMRMKSVVVAMFLAAIPACSETTPDAGAPASAPGDAPEAGPPAALAAEIADGRAIAERECGQCHALDDDTESPRNDAPPLRVLLSRYDAEALATDLIEGIKLGHEDMPLFDFNVIAADALIAYLTSIRPEVAE